MLGCMHGWMRKRRECTPTLREFGIAAPNPLDEFLSSFVAGFPGAIVQSAEPRPNRVADSIVVKPKGQEKISCFHERSNENIPAVAGGRLQKWFHSPKQRCGAESEQEACTYLGIRVDVHATTSDPNELRGEFC
jgi:hypothetical protein